MTPLPRRTVVAVVVLGLLALLPAVAGAAPADDCTWRVTAQQLAAALPDQDDPAAQRLLRILRNAGFTGEAQIIRRQSSLVRWMERVCSAPHDEAYFLETAKIGRIHVRIGLPQRYMFTAMALIRGASCC